MTKQKLITIFFLFSINYIKKHCLFSSTGIETYLNTIWFPKLTKEKIKTLEGEITEKELLILLQNTENNKSLGDDGLTKEFYITFWNKVRAPFLLAIEKAYLVRQLSASQKQAVIKLIKKRLWLKVYSKLVTYSLT